MRVEGALWNIVHALQVLSVFTVDVFHYVTQTVRKNLKKKVI